MNETRVVRVRLDNLPAVREAAAVAWGAEREARAELAGDVCDGGRAVAKVLWGLVSVLGLGWLLAAARLKWAAIWAGGLFWTARRVVAVWAADLGQQVNAGSAKLLAKAGGLLERQGGRLRERFDVRQAPPLP